MSNSTEQLLPQPTEAFAKWSKSRALQLTLKKVCIECGNDPDGKCGGCGVPLCGECLPYCADCEDLKGDKAYD